MSIGKIIKSIFSKNTVSTIIAVTDAQKAIAALKHTTIGAAVAADIKALASSTLSGPEKFEAVVKNTAPLIVEFLSENGLKKAEAEVMDLVREFTQSCYNSIASQKAETIGSLILKVLGLK